MKRYLALATLLALAACGSDKDTTTITTDEGSEVKITSDKNNSSDSGTITFEGKDGEGKISFGEAAAKEGLPLGLPVYPGGEVKGAFMGGDDKSGSKGGMATVMTKDAPAKVAAFYKAEAERRGLKVETQTTSGDNMSFTAKGGNETSLVVNASAADGGGTAASIIGGSKN